MSTAVLLEWLVACLTVIGSGFALIGAWGLAKLSSFERRVHGPTKATTAGIGCVLAASLVHFGPTVHEVLVILFLFLSAPVSAHLLMKAALARRPEAKPLEPGSTPRA